MDIYWPHNTAAECSRILSSREFKHLLTPFGTEVTEGTPWGLPVCKSVVNVSNFNALYETFYTYSNGLEILLSQYIISS